MAGAESNRRHADFQSAALPTELPGRAARTEPQRIWDGVLDFIGWHWARFQANGNRPVPRNLFGWIDGNTYLFTRQPLKEAT